MSTWTMHTEHIHVLIWAGLQPKPRHIGALSWHTPIPDGQERHPDSEWVGAMGMPLPYNKFELRPDTADRVGRMLVGANYRSFNDRYEDSEDSDGQPVGQREPAVYRYKRPRDTGWSPAELLKALQCYAYNSGDPSDWRQTEAYAFCQALQDHLISNLPGYSEAPWGIDDQTRSAATWAALAAS